MTETVDGTRLWGVEYVRAECPECGAENLVYPSELFSCHMWGGQPFKQRCRNCSEWFKVEVDGDERREY